MQIMKRTWSPVAVFARAADAFEILKISEKNVMTAIFFWTGERGAIIILSTLEGNGFSLKKPYRAEKEDGM
jgi:hypothetical protein